MRVRLHLSTIGTIFHSKVNLTDSIPVERKEKLVERFDELTLDPKTVDQLMRERKLSEQTELVSEEQMVYVAYLKNKYKVHITLMKCTLPE